MRYSRNKRYFFPRRIGTAVLMLLSGLLTATLGLDKGIMLSLIIGCVLLLGGIAMFALAVSTKLIKDSALDEQRDLFAADAVSRAMNHFGLTSEAVDAHEPVVIKTYYFNTKDAPALVKIGKDGVPRANNCEALVLLFSNDTLYWYDFKFSLVFKDEITNTPDTILYTDIKNVAAEAAKLPCETTRWKKIFVNCKHFKIESADKTLSAYLATPDMQTTVDEVKAFLRRMRKTAAK
ncbi:MAG: hypothetical protein RR232_06730 [Clostridia bacterium]